RRRRRARLRHAAARLPPFLARRRRVAAVVRPISLRLACGAQPDGAPGRNGAARALGRLGPLAVHGRQHEARLGVGEAVRIDLPIETERLVIRPLELEDAEDLGQSEEWIREKIDRFERDGGMSLWAAVDQESGRAVALAGLQWEQIDGRRELDLGCVVATHAQQRGYATEASEAIVSAAFAAGCERLTAMTGPDNAAALHVLEKLEFTPHGETSFEGRRYAFFIRQR